MEIPGDGGPFQRLCSKMATGTGKTLVMAMAIAWQSLNRAVNSGDERFSKDFLVVAPGLTVKSRLSVLRPQDPENYYKKFRLVPQGLEELISHARVHVTNWHSLGWDTWEDYLKKKTVDKRGPLSDLAYTKEILGDMSEARGLIVINDEAHHAWRFPAESKLKGVKKDEIDTATKWIDGLDRINQVCGIKQCLDFSATPYAPTGNKTAEEALFTWIVSDFGLNDAIESGLTKTPRVVVRSAGKIDPSTYKPRLYHIYSDPEVKEDLNRPTKEEEPLPPLVTNAYYLLGVDWQETAKVWKDAGMTVPPVMISVVNRTETAARIKFAFDNGRIKIPELCVKSKTLQIDSSVLKNAEAEDSFLPESVPTADEDDRKLTKAEHAEYLRLTVDTVGKVGYPGEQIQNVISVGMLSEGWDARTVTHIMGLRAFTSQLLCEQVVGRGLRRTSYEVDPGTGFFQAEYVNVFGIPFSFLPFEGGEETTPRPEVPRLAIFPEPTRTSFEITWPNISKLEYKLRQSLNIDSKNIPQLVLNAAEISQIADLAPTIDGHADLDSIKTIDLENLAKSLRLQRLIFESAQDVYDQLQPGWPGDKTQLLGQLVQIVEQFLLSKRFKIIPKTFGDDEFKKKLMIMLSARKIVQHLFQGIRNVGVDSVVPVFDEREPIRSTAQATTWYTSKPCERMTKTHFNLCAFDSTWEKAVCLEIDRNKDVVAWCKNDHLGFVIYYMLNGSTRKYIPDFLVKLANGMTLILEVKGQEKDKDKTKWTFLDEWIKAVNTDGRFGKWVWKVSKSASGADVAGILRELTSEKGLDKDLASGE